MVNFENEDFIYEIIRNRVVSIKRCKEFFGNFTAYGNRNPSLHPIAKRIMIPETVLHEGEEYFVRQIGKSVFDNLTSVEEIFIPKTVLKINWGFYHCYNLKSFQVDSANPKYCDIDGVLFSKDEKRLIAYPNKHGSTYKIPTTVEEIGNMAFKSCNELTELQIPSSVIVIGINVFYECYSLKSVMLPLSIKEIQNQSEQYTITEFIYQNQSFRADELNKNFRSLIE